MKRATRCIKCIRRYRLLCVARLQDAATRERKKINEKIHLRSGKPCAWGSVKKELAHIRINMLLSPIYIVIPARIMQARVRLDTSAAQGAGVTAVPDVQVFHLRFHPSIGSTRAAAPPPRLFACSHLAHVSACSVPS